MASVLFAAFEGLPFVKTGGLADVIYALPKALDKSKYEVRVVLPLFKKIKDKYYPNLKHLAHFEVHSGFINEGANVYSYINEGIEYLFIENDTYFYRDNIYGYEDDVTRFSFYNVAILEMMIAMNYYPDIIHCHDYHTGMVAALCKLRYQQEKIKKIKHIFTIHNLVYQGIYNKQVLFDLLAFDYQYFHDGTLRFGEDCNFMKTAIACSDVITTVSKSYSYEIQGAELGENLQDILSYRKDDLYGIVNGIDTDIFNPKTDAIACNYDLRNYLKGKAANKEALQKELGLEIDADAFVVGMVSRLTFQKGAKLIEESLSHILDMHVQVVILGTGEEHFENCFRDMENGHKGKAVFYRGYNEALAHSIYAGIDMLLMPSLFEPCGISQLIAMRYGTLPLVRETGGLKDTVEPYNCFNKTGRGFSFKNYEAYDFIKIFDYAYETYNNYKNDWKMLVRNAMKYDVSFAKSAKEYEELYQKLNNAR